MADLCEKSHIVREIKASLAFEQIKNEKSPFVDFFFMFDTDGFYLVMKDVMK